MIGLIAALLAVVTTPYAPVSYACDGSTATFTVNFPYQNSTDLAVTVVAGTGDISTLIPGTDYSVNVVSTQSTATLTLTSPSAKCPTGRTLKIARSMTLTQPTGFRQQTVFDPRLHETSIDRAVMLTQEEAVTRAATDGSMQSQLNNIVTNGIQATTGAAFTRTPSDSAPSNGFNIVVNPETNSVAADVHSSTIGGGGLNAFLQKIGSVAGSNASYATISGGYDNINNMLAGTISGGAHHFLDGSLGGDHAVISGGSFNTINTTGHYSSIGGGTGNTVTGTGSGGRIGGGVNNVERSTGVIGGGSLNDSSGDSAVIGGGSSNSIDSNGIAGVIGGGTQNVISGVGAADTTIAGGTQNSVKNIANAPNFGTVGGGLNNSVQHFAGVIAGGQNNLVTGNSAAILGGTTNTASATRAIVNGGASNVASGQDSYVPFGQQNIASGQYSSARGLRALSANNGQHCTAVGFFAANGDAQSCEFTLHKITTDATNSSFTVDGASLMVLPDNTTWTFEAIINARRTDAADDAGYKLEGVIKRGVGVASTAIVGAVTKTVYAETDVAWDVSATADTTSGDLRLRSTGAIGKTVRWVALVRLASASQ